MDQKSKHLALFVEIERLLGELTLADYVVPAVSVVPKNAESVGEATERMKGLWTLFIRHELVVTMGKLGKEEVLRRGIHDAICYELGEYCGWGSHFGITKDWIVYRTKTGNAPRETVSTH